MADRLYLRHSTDKQTNLRQKHNLASYLEAGAPTYEDPATSSRLHPLKRPGVVRLLDEAAVGDVVRLADAARLFRSVKDVLDVRDVLRRRGLHLRIASGPWAGMDLTSEDPMTKLFVTMLAGVLEFQRDMISENTKDGVAAARAGGKTLGRPARLSAAQAAEVVRDFEAGTAIKALARQHAVDPKVIRRALDLAGARTAPDLDTFTVEDAKADQPQTATADPVVVVDVPGLVTEHLADIDDDGVRQALAAGQTIRRGQGHLVRVTAPVSVHVSMVEHTATALMQSPAGRKAHRIHSDRVTGVRNTP
ncbi:recombinase family protein [Streptomyces parvus]|uniref:recombinase family protein n=1 Tax=Streptomyces parvus TaxID=66428 RepID=UPI002100A746|nr:recombinase family protein [Streptomyces parvus]MCQ1582298.1 recombinase family protein [Streptomyces parvus]